jgi:hypothetical protein
MNRLLFNCQQKADYLEYFIGDRRMNISDLNYFESANEGIMGGTRFYRPSRDINADIKVRKDAYIVDTQIYTVDALVVAQAHIVGNIAVAEAGADASGANTFTSTLSFSDAQSFYGSESYSSSVSAAY